MQTRTTALICLLLHAARRVAAQDPATVAVTVEISHDTPPVADATVRSGAVARPTDADGRAVLRLPPGEHQIVTAKIGYTAESLTVTLRAGTDTTVRIAVAKQAIALSGIIVSATRSGRRIEDEPLATALARNARKAARSISAERAVASR